MSFTTKYPKSSSTIGTKKNLNVKLILFTKHCHVQNKYSDDACDGAYSANSLNDCID